MDEDPKELPEQSQRVPVKGDRSTTDRPLSMEAIPLSSWTASAVSQSGPKFRSLSSEQQSMIKKLHINLGHPTSEKLSKHLKSGGSPKE